MILERHRAIETVKQSVGKFLNEADVAQKAVHLLAVGDSSGAGLRGFVFALSLILSGSAFCRSFRASALRGSDLLFRVFRRSFGASAAVRP